MLKINKVGQAGFSSDYVFMLSNFMFGEVDAFPIYVKQRSRLLYDLRGT